MGKLNDLTGQTFDRLTVLERAPFNSTEGRAMWNCQCSCGNIVTYSGSVLLKGRATSCGCKRKEDLTGKVFGRLTVIKYSESRKGSRYWECLCDCGNIVYVPTKSLKSGNTKSCGCLHSETTIKNNINLKSKINQEEIIGKRFDFLEVIARVDSSEGTQTKYKCYCHNCKNYKDIKYSDLVSGRVHACGCLNSWGEAKLKKIMSEGGINFKTQFSFDDLRSEQKYPLRFDFAIYDEKEQLRCLLEYQGGQHIDQENPYWSEGLEQRDKMKKEYCKNHNIKLFFCDKETNLEEFVLNLRGWLAVGTIGIF